MFKLELLLKMHFLVIKNKCFDVDYLPKRVDSSVSITPVT